MRPSIIALLVVGIHTCVFAADGPLVPEGAAVEQVATGHRFTEGPALGPDGAIYFSDIPNNRVHRFDPDSGETTVVLEDSGGGNGMAWGGAGEPSLILCEGRSRRVTTRRALLDDAGKVTGFAEPEVLADTFDDKPLNSPNDLAVIGDGALVYFTDPRYGNRDSMELEIEGVYMIWPDHGEGRRLQRVIDNIERPNGIALSNNGMQLYVADNTGGQVMVYDVHYSAPHQPTGRVFAKPPAGTRGGPDGMTVDRAGNLYAAWHGANAVFAWNPEGEPAATIPVPEQPTNATFGADGETLYITAGKSLYRIGLDVPESSTD